MKKIKLTVVLLITVLLAGCSSSIPKWYLEPPMSNDIFYGVGDANRPQQAMSKKVATARARDEIAQAVEVKVSTMINDFMDASGIGNDATAHEFNKAVSKHVAQVALKGSVISKTFVAKDGSMYVMVEYPAKGASDEAVKKAKNEMKKDEALFNEFKANQGFDALERELNSMNAIQ